MCQLAFVRHFVLHSWLADNNDDNDDDDVSSGTWPIPQPPLSRFSPFTTFWTHTFLSWRTFIRVYPLFLLDLWHLINFNEFLHTYNHLQMNRIALTIQPSNHLLLFAPIILCVLFYCWFGFVLISSTLIYLPIIIHPIPCVLLWL